MKFDQAAPILMKRLMHEFGMDVESAAAVAGNGGHESGGFTKLQEINPTVPGSRGGFGWFQWTGPRRRQFETYCSANALSPTSNEANIGFLIYELKRDESKAVSAVKSAKGLRAKVEAFERAYERAGVKHYDSREKWARRALVAYKGKPSRVPEASAGAGGGAIVTTGTTAAGFDFKTAIVLGLVAAFFISFVIYMMRKR